MLLRSLMLVTAFLASFSHAASDDLVGLQSNIVAATIESNPLVASLVQQGLETCATGGESDEERLTFVKCMNNSVFERVSRWGICGKRFPTLDARVLQPCMDDQARAHKLAVASVSHVEPVVFNRCALESLYEPTESVISAFYSVVTENILATKFNTNAGNSFVLSLAPFDAEKMLACVAQ